MAKYEGTEHENMLKKKMTRNESYQEGGQLMIKWGEYVGTHSQ